MAASTREEIRVGEMAIRFLLEGEQSDGSVAVFEFNVPAGSKVAAAHSHDSFEETIYGLEGTLVWTVEGQAHEVGSGEVLCIPRGAVHQFANVSELGAKALAIVTPGILGPEYFRGSPRSSMRQPAALLTWLRSRRSCAATDSPPSPDGPCERERTYDPASADSSQGVTRLSPRRLHPPQAGARLTLPAGTMIPLPSTQVAHAQHILMVEFTSPDGRTSKAIGGGDTLDAAIAFAQNSCPTDATWHPISWTDLYGD